MASLVTLESALLPFLLAVRDDVWAEWAMMGLVCLLTWRASSTGWVRHTRSLWTCSFRPLEKKTTQIPYPHFTIHSIITGLPDTVLKQLDMTGIVDNFFPWNRDRTSMLFKRYKVAFQIVCYGERENCHRVRDGVMRRRRIFSSWYAFMWSWFE